MKHMPDIGRKLLLLVLALFLLTSAAYADVVFNPGNNFYDRYHTQCEPNIQHYEAWGPGGEIIVYKSPIRKKEVCHVENGKPVNIRCVYTDTVGTRWGYYECLSHRVNKKSGWVPMDYLKLCYDNGMFLQDYANSIREEEFTVNEDGVLAQVTVWDYPGSDRQNVYLASAGYKPQGNSIYSDECGRNWGYVEFYGYPNGVIEEMWILLDAPEASAETVYPEGLPERDMRPEPEDNGTRITPNSKGAGRATLGVTLLCILAIAAAAILLVGVKKNETTTNYGR